MNTQEATQAGKAEKFVELATSRVNNALKTLKLIGNLANRNNYDYDDKQAGKIIRALQSGLDDVKAKFAAPNGKGDREGFSL